MKLNLFEDLPDHLSSEGGWKSGCDNSAVGTRKIQTAYT